MRRKVFSLIGLLVLITVLLSACGGQQQNEENEALGENNTQEEVHNAENDVQKADMIIVGGGGAGLSAAMKAAEEGLDVIVLEKNSFVGGNALVSSGIIQAAGTSFQEEFGIEGDTPEKFMDEMTVPDSPYKNPDRPLSTIMYEGSRDIVEELVDRGLEFAELDEVNKRQHFVAPPPKGAPNMIKLLEETAIDAGATIEVDTEATELITDGDRVVGVKAKQGDKEVEYHGEAVLMATGGFAANNEMLSEYMPQFADLPTWGQPGTTGDGIKMSEKVDAATVAMDGGMHLKLVNNDTKTSPNVRRGILVNVNGERFYDETTRLYSEMAKAAIDQPEKRGYTIIDDQILADNEGMFDQYLEEGLAKSADSLEELADELNMPNLVETVTNYNVMVDEDEDTDFGRTLQLNSLTGDKFYAIEVEPHPYNTYGGLEIDEKAHVLNTEGEVIPGLYAAGEVTGSVEVQEGLEYTTGNGQALVFGRLAVETFMEERE